MGNELCCRKTSAGGGVLAVEGEETWRAEHRAHWERAQDPGRPEKWKPDERPWLQRLQTSPDGTSLTDGAITFRAHPKELNESLAIELFTKHLPRLRQLLLSNNAIR